MLSRYVLADLLRNPRRTLSTMVGVMLGVGLFCGVLFFVDGLSASMTQRAVAPLPIDMQRIVTERVGGSLLLRQSFDAAGELAAGEQATVRLELRNESDVVANEVTVRSLPGADLRFVAGSAEVDGVPIEDAGQNPFAQGPGKAGLNIGTLQAGSTLQFRYRVEALSSVELSNDVVRSTYSSRESVSPVASDEQTAIPLDELARMIADVDGVAAAQQLSFADLGSDTLSAAGESLGGAAKIFGFDTSYAEADRTVTIVAGALGPDVAAISVEAGSALKLDIGDTVTIALPDGSSADLRVGAIADLSQARSLFSSRRGGDLETFIYTQNSVVVSPEVFAELVLPAYERAATTRGDRLKNPPVREIDITLDRERLDADPATALLETERIAGAIADIASRQDFVLDNISNTLSVASADAAVAKRLFVFLGVPGGVLAALLAGYAGTVLADAQRREQATLRIRGAGRHHLLHMLALRTGLLTVVGSVFGLGLGYVAASVILGQGSLGRASAASLVRSGAVGSLGGLFATGFALYLTGRRSIDREINEDRARLSSRAPLWRRAWLDVVGTAIVVIGTAAALQRHAFDGAAGSVYFGRAVELNLILLMLPLALWMSGSLLAARVFGALLTRRRPESSSDVGRPLFSLYLFSVSRRPWAIANGAVLVSLIVGIATSLGAFTASYDDAKVQDARYANGSDLRITPSPTSPQTYGARDAELFRGDGVKAITPVIYGVSNVILRSARTSDPANLAAIDPMSFAAVAPVRDDQFTSADAAAAMRMLRDDPTAVLVSEDMAAFLKADVGDSLRVLLARATDDQIEIDLRIVGFYERLPGFPEGVDAVMGIAAHEAAIASKAPDFFLGATTATDDSGLSTAVAELRAGPASSGHIRIDTRLTTLASDQSSLAALNIAGLVELDSVFALAMAVVTIAIFVFGLLLQRRREYITLRAQGVEPSTIRLLIAAEAGTVAVGGAAGGVLVGASMGYVFVSVLRPLFVLTPTYSLPVSAAAIPVVLVVVAAVLTSLTGSRMVSRLDPTELLREE